jgi:hypothetical protein
MAHIYEQKFIKKHTHKNKSHKIQMERTKNYNNKIIIIIINQIEGNKSCKRGLPF